MFCCFAFDMRTFRLHDCLKKACLVFVLLLSNLKLQKAFCISRLRFFVFQKKKIDKLDFIQIKIYCSAKDTEENENTRHILGGNISKHL